MIHSNRAKGQVAWSSAPISWACQTLKQDSAASIAIGTNARHDEVQLHGVYLHRAFQMILGFHGYTCVGEIHSLQKSRQSLDLWGIKGVAWHWIQCDTQVIHTIVYQFGEAFAGQVVAIGKQTQLSVR